MYLRPAVAALVLLLAPAYATAQDLTALTGRWQRDLAREPAPGPLGVPSNDALVIEPRGVEIAIRRSGYVGVFRLGGVETTTLSDGRTGTAVAEAGRLSLTLRRARPGGATNVMNEVYHVNGDTLTIERTLNVVLADGSLGPIAGGNRWTMVYRRN